MAGTLFDLAESMKKKVKAIEQAASDRAVEIALTITGELAYKTPVDTSKALSNWIVTLNKPSERKIDPHYPGESGSTYVPSAAETINLAKEVLAKKRPKQDIYITNNQPYIRRLNEGHSQQQDPGFVERAILVGRKSKSKVKIKG